MIAFLSYLIFFLSLSSLVSLILYFAVADVFMWVTLGLVVAVFSLIFVVKKLQKKAGIEPLIERAMKAKETYDK
ncbi:MAG: hypothetical protein J6M18_04630 [Actinomycetaceae bacterium]|nr:hypothetical protein [Actinomycetaceae bacterium]